MNYLLQILAFDDYLLYNQKLSSGQIALWRALMSINNKAGWAEWFTAANATLESLSGLSRSGINKNRNTLKQLGLIDFRSNGKKATSYKVCVLYTSNSTQESVQQSTQQGVQDSTQHSVQQSSTLNKLKQNKNKTKQNNDDDARVIIRYWQQEINPLERVEQMDRVASFLEDGLPAAVICRAIDETKTRGVNSVQYTIKILNDWISRQVTTIEQAEQALTDFNNQFKLKKKKSGGIKETLPYWARDDYSWEEYEKMTDAERAERGWV